jgi:hypothetical protein
MQYRRSLETYLNSMLDSELFYLYTNDINYLIGDFGKPVSFILSRPMRSSSRKLPRIP